MTLVVLTAAFGSALMAGLFFAFSTAVMTALGRIEPAAGIAAMQRINEVIQNPVFFLAFFGTALASFAVIAAAVLGWNDGPALTSAAGALAYLVGIVGVTILFNVPMNSRLAVVDPASVEGARVWADYLARWTAWNHLRTVSGMVAAGLFALGLR